MKLQLSPPTLYFITSAIKSAITQNSISTGNSLHALSTKLGYFPGTALCNHLLNLYSKCGSLDDAHKLFDEMPDRNLISFSTLISAHSRSGNPKLALHLMSQLSKLSILLNQFVFSSSILACSKLNSLCFGRQIHAQVVVTGFEADPFVNTTLIDMYTKVGDRKSVVSVFGRCPVGDPVLFNSMVCSCVSFGAYEEALRIFGDARKEFDFKPTEFSFGSLIKASLELGRDVGEQLHGFIVKSGFDSNCFIGTSLVDMYGEFGDMESVEIVFGSISSIDVALYNAMVAGYSKNGLDKMALRYFCELMSDGLSPNECTFSGVLKACGGLKSCDLGRMIHGLVEKSKFRQDLVVNTALNYMYWKCGQLGQSCRVFDSMHEKNTVSYNSMIFGQGQNGNSDEALSLFMEMKRQRIDADLATFVALMSSSLGGEWRIYVHAIKHGFGSDLMVKNLLLNGLLKKGSAEEALEFFNKMKERNVVSWTTIISGLTQLGFHAKGVELFREMYSTAVNPNSFTFSSVVKACGSVAGLDQGRCIHGSIIKQGIMDNFISSSLLDMYAKCGVLEDSRRLFDRLAYKDVVLWNSMITGYAQHGHAVEALELYKMMERHSAEPNNITFVSLLLACSRCGLVEDGVQLFDLMESKHGIKPIMEHYACMVDIFGRAGMLERAELCIKNMPFEADTTVWTVFLAACKLHGKVELAHLAREHVKGTQGEDNSTLVLMSNMYSEGGKWDDAERSRKRMESWGMIKEPGYSWVQCV